MVDTDTSQTQGNGWVACSEALGAWQAPLQTAEALEWTSEEGNSEREAAHPAEPLFSSRAHYSDSGSGSMSNSSSPFLSGPAIAMVVVQPSGPHAGGHLLCCPFDGSAVLRATRLNRNVKYLRLANRPAGRRGWYIDYQTTQQTNLLCDTYPKSLPLSPVVQVVHRAQ